MAKKRSTTAGSAKRVAAAKRRQKVADKHIGRRGGTRVRTINAPKPW